MIEKFLDFQLYTFKGFATEPEIKYFESGSCKTTFSIPLKHKKEDEALFLNCEIWNDLAEKASEEIKKGFLVVVQGNLVESEYKDKTYVKLVVDNYRIVD